MVLDLARLGCDGQQSHRCDCKQCLLHLHFLSTYPRSDGPKGPCRSYTQLLRPGTLACATHCGGHIRTQETDLLDLPAAGPRSRGPLSIVDLTCDFHSHLAFDIVLPSTERAISVDTPPAVPARGSFMSLPYLLSPRSIAEGAVSGIAPFPRSWAIENNADNSCFPIDPDFRPAPRKDRAQSLHRHRLGLRIREG